MILILLLFKIKKILYLINLWIKNLVRILVILNFKIILYTQKKVSDWHLTFYLIMYI